MSAPPVGLLEVLDVVIGTNVSQELYLTAPAGVLGRVTLRHGKTTSLISTLFVRADVRGRGVGTWLVQECERRAAANHRVSVHLIVNRGNEKIGGFYRRLGFAPAYEWDDGEVLFVKELKPVCPKRGDTGWQALENCGGAFGACECGRIPKIS